MLAIKGIFDNGKVKLEKQVHSTKPLHVIVTFLDDVNEENDELIDLNKFSFLQSQEVLKNLKSSLSDTVIEERKIEL
jgi:hypothetical protein